MSDMNPKKDQTSEIKTGESTVETAKTEYFFGGLQEFNLEQIEGEVLSGSVYLDVFAGSDERLKENIAPISGALDKLIHLRGVTFDWNQQQIPTTWPQAPKTPQVGLIAQDVLAQMPNLVREDQAFLTVNYQQMIPYLVESIKALHENNQEQAARIKDLEDLVSTRGN